MYEKLSRPGLLGMEGDPPTRDNFSPYKQALIKAVTQQGLNPLTYKSGLTATPHEDFTNILKREFTLRC